MAKRENTSYNKTEGESAVSSSKTTESPKKDIGYVKGYSQYVSRTGAHSTNGSGLNKTVKKNGEEGITTPSTYKLYDVQSDEFRRIFGLIECQIIVMLILIHTKIQHI